MIHEHVATHSVVCPLEPERDLPALHTSTPRTSTSSHRAGRRSTSQSYSATKEICDRAIALLHSQGLGHREVDGWRRGGRRTVSVVWALDDPDERSPPSSFVAQCDTAEVLTLVLAAAVTKRRRNARLAAAALVSISLRSWTRCKQDGKEKGKIVARSKPAGELWRRLIRVYSSAPAAVAAANTVGLQPQVIFMLKAWTRLDPQALIMISRRC